MVPHSFVLLFYCLSIFPSFTTCSELPLFSTTRDQQLQIRQDISKNYTVFCQPNNNFTPPPGDDDQKRCVVFAKTQSGFIRGFTQTSSVSGSDVDVFLGVSLFIQMRQTQNVILNINNF